MRERICWVCGNLWEIGEWRGGEGLSNNAYNLQLAMTNPTSRVPTSHVVPPPPSI